MTNDMEIKFSDDEVRRQFIELVHRSRPDCRETVDGSLHFAKPIGQSGAPELSAATFNVGDHVLMRRHGDWRADATGTIRKPHPLFTIFSKPGEWAGHRRTVRKADGQDIELYYLEFDEPQFDLTDPTTAQKGCTVASEFLQIFESKHEGTNTGQPQGPLAADQPGG